MIKSKVDYKYYLERDRIALNVKPKNLEGKIIGVISPNPIYTFQKSMRKSERDHSDKSYNRLNFPKNSTDILCLKRETRAVAKVF